MYIIYLDLEVFENHFLCGLLLNEEHITFERNDSIDSRELKWFLENHSSDRFITGHNLCGYDLLLLFHKKVYCL